MKAGRVLRSCLFAAFQILITPPFAVIAFATLPLAPVTRCRIIALWSRLIIGAAGVICGVRYRVLGAEHIPAHGCVILSKHQSAWETMAFQLIFPPQVYVIKRSLLWIPFFGWGLALTSPIAIDRSAGMRAMRKMLEQGAKRLMDGFWIVVYPEGTRLAPGVHAPYQTGGAAIAVRAGAAVLPVAHNAGRCWPRNSFVKRPGLITVSIGPAIDTRGKKADALTREVEDWIESEMPKLDRNQHAA
jgi:1-acyl-sn-glycerol-3-phosphate acyltransferase